MPSNGPPLAAASNSGSKRQLHSQSSSHGSHSSNRAHHGSTLKVSEFKHAQGVERLEQVQQVYGSGRGKPSALEERVARLEKENKLLRLRIEPIGEDARRAAETAARNIRSGVDDAKAKTLEAWHLDAWIRSFSFDAVVASALVKHLHQQSHSKASGLRERDYMANLHSLGSEQTILALLRDANVLEEIAMELWRGTATLSQQMDKRQAVEAAAEPPPPDAFELNTKYIDAGAHALAFGSLAMFYSGLSGLVGAPSSRPAEGMRAEHCAAADADALFSVSNYGTRTTSRVEWHFVARADAGREECRAHLGRLGIADGAHYPKEERLISDPSFKEHVRQPMPPSAFRSLGWDAVDEKLRAVGVAPLSEAEFIAARLYTGPCYRKYNAVLRSRGDVAALEKEWTSLCHGNLYTTTLHLIDSAITKLGKIKTVDTLYRAPGGALPSLFLSRNEFNVSGGVELAFMSCTNSREVALDYAVTSKAAVLFQIQEGFVDRGADLSWLSQYPHEREITFPPLTSLEVTGKQVEGTVLVVNLAPRRHDAPTMRDASKSSKSSVCSVM
ncbi:hypothetical protein AB1Y20_006983 [Prymnesium parvum]|uniref:NAD(P)(+)--arginine ADP-ribosyltransferase n=1 Tax=Prymnesium parvum TaxID=97485 RepID=A0AB34IZ42_PRYPA